MHVMVRVRGGLLPYHAEVMIRIARSQLKPILVQYLKIRFVLVTGTDRSNLKRLNAYYMHVYTILSPTFQLTSNRVYIRSKLIVYRYWLRLG